MKAFAAKINYFIKSIKFFYIKNEKFLELSSSQLQVEIETIEYHFSARKWIGKSRI